MKSDFWKTADGRWRWSILVLLPIFVVSAVYGVFRDGLTSLTGIQYSLMAVSVAAPALEPPHRAAGAAAFVAAAGMLAYRIARDILHW